MGIQYRSMKFLIFKEYLIERETFVQIDASYFYLPFGKQNRKKLEKFTELFYEFKKRQKNRIIYLIYF